MVPFTYVTNADSTSIQVTQYTGSNATTVVPNTINFLPVTVVGPNTFYTSGVSSVTIGDNVTNISDWAFGLSDLTSITIPDNVTTIGGSVFDACWSLTNVVIGDGLKNIGGWDFDGCQSLTNIKLGSGVTNIGESAFDGCAMTNIMIPNKVTAMQDDAFRACKNLTSFTIPRGVTTIGNNAFEDCGSLTNIVIPNSVVSIGDSAFVDDSSLSNIHIPDSVVTIGGSAFENCGGLTKINIPRSVTSMSGDVFSGCSGLTAINVDPLNPNYTSVDGVVFDKNVTTVLFCPQGKTGSFSIPSNVTSISYAAFYETGLTEVITPASVTYIGNYAFFGCGNLTSLYFQGNAPGFPMVGNYSVFFGDPATAYYLPGTTGWGASYIGIPTLLWDPHAQTSDAHTQTGIGTFGIRNHQFGFSIVGNSNLVVVVEACTNMANPFWMPVQTNTLVGGSSYFSDAEWTNHPARFYRISSP